MNPIYTPGSRQSDNHRGPEGAIIAPGGAISLPGLLHLFCNGNAEGKSSGGFGVVSLSIPRGGVALHVTFSPEGLRHFAGRCLEMAKDLEATAATEAAAAIERAKAAGK